MTKQEAHDLGYKNGLAGVYLPYNVEPELLDDYEQGWEKGMNEAP